MLRHASLCLVDTNAESRFAKHGSSQKQMQKTSLQSTARLRNKCRKQVCRARLVSETNAEINIFKERLVSETRAENRFAVHGLVSETSAESQFAEHGLSQKPV